MMEQTTSEKLSPAKPETEQHNSEMEQNLAKQSIERKLPETRTASELYREYKEIAKTWPWYKPSADSDESDHDGKCNCRTVYKSSCKDGTEDSSDSDEEIPTFGWYDDSDWVRLYLEKDDDDDSSDCESNPVRPFIRARRNQP